MPDILAGTYGQPDERTVPPPAPPKPSADDALTGQLKGLQDEEIGLMKKQEAEEAPARQRLLGGMRDYAQSAERLRPKLKDVKEFQPTDLRQTSWEWMSLAATFGALAGAFSRQHATTALNAFGGAMQGWAQGNMVKFKQDYQTWKANADAARINNEKEMEEYRAVMENKRLNIDQMMTEVQMIGAKYHNQIAISAAQQKNLTQLAQLVDHTEANRAKMAESQARIEVSIAKLEAAMDPLGKNLNTPAGILKMIEIAQDPKTDPTTRQTIRFILSGKNPTGTMPEFPDAAEKSKPGWIENWIARLTGAPTGAAQPSAGATAATPPAQPAAAGAPTPAPAPTPAAPPAPPSGVQGPTRQSSAIPAQGVVRQPGVAGRAGQRPRDGSTEQQAIVLSTNRATAARQAATLKDGTWVIDPRTNQPAQIKRGGAPATTAGPADVERALGG